MNQNSEYDDERIVPSPPFLLNNRQVYLEHKARYDFASKYVKNHKCLDIACGVGYGCEILLSNDPKKIIGIDISERAIEYAKKHFLDHRLFFYVGDATNIMLSDLSIDIVISFETIEHLRDYQIFLKEINRILRPPGRFIISSPNRDRNIKLPGSPSNPYHIIEFSKKELIKILKQSGFDCIDIFAQKILPGNQYLIRILRFLLKYSITMKLNFIIEIFNHLKKLYQLIFLRNNIKKLRTPNRVIPYSSKYKVYQNFIIICQKRN